MPALRAAAPEIARERFTVEPLADDVLHLSARPRGDRGSARERLRDGEVPPREPEVQLAPFLEARDDRARERGVERRREVQALDARRCREADVVCAIDDAE